MTVVDEINTKLNSIYVGFMNIQTSINNLILTGDMKFDDYSEIPVKEIYRYISNAPISSVDDLNPPVDLPAAGNDIASKLILINALKEKIKETIEGFYDGAITIPFGFRGYVTYIGIDTLVLTADKTIVAPDEKATLSLKLTTTRDYGGVSGIPVKLTKNGAVMGTYTTDSNGEFTVEYTPENAGEDVFVARLGNAKSSPVTLTVQEPVYNISLAANKTECMVGDTVTLTATLTADIGSVAGKEIVFDIGGSQYSTITNNIGTATYTYNGVGVGDLTVMSKYNTIHSNTVIIEDCYFFDDGTSAAITDYDLSALRGGVGTTNFTQEPDCKLLQSTKTVPNSSGGSDDRYRLKPNCTVTEEYSIEVDMKITDFMCTGICLWEKGVPQTISSSKILYFIEYKTSSLDRLQSYKDDKIQYLSHNWSSINDEWIKLKIEVLSSNIVLTAYANDGVVITTTSKSLDYTNSTPELMIQQNNGQAKDTTLNFYFKNLKIKKVS